MSLRLFKRQIVFSLLTTLFAFFNFASALSLNPCDNSSPDDFLCNLVKKYAKERQILQQKQIQIQNKSNSPLLNGNISGICFACTKYSTTPQAKPNNPLSQLLGAPTGQSGSPSGSNSPSGSSQNNNQPSSTSNGNQSAPGNQTPPPGSQYNGEVNKGKVQSDGSCVAFGDSLGYGISKNGPKALCIHYHPDGSTGDGFVYANGGKSFNNFMPMVEKAMNDPKVKVIDWELGTNHLAGNCAQCGTDYPGKIYQQLAEQAHKNNKILVLAAYNNTYSQRNDYVARQLAQKYPDNVKLIDYTKIVSKPDGGDNIHYNGNTYAKMGAERAAILAELQKTKGS